MVNKPPMPPGSEGLPADDANSSERRPAGRRTAGGTPVDPATLHSGARPEASRLPHEHDEHADKPQAPRPKIVQAEADLEAGLEDTDCRGIPNDPDGKKSGGHCP